MLYTSMEGVSSATAGSGRVDTEVLSDSLLDEIMKVVLSILQSIDSPIQVSSASLEHFIQFLGYYHLPSRWESTKLPYTF